MAITAAMVKDLRERTGAGMMECKKALTASNGDIEVAVEEMRKAGQAKADKKAGRTAAEGVICLNRAADKQHAVIVEINSETDFVARDDNFNEFAKQVGETLISNEAVSDVDALLETNIEAVGFNVEETRKQLITKIGENIKIRRFARMSSENNVGSYVHGGRIGVLVEIKGGDEALAKDVAMHIAASKPVVVSKEQVSQDLIDKEKEIFTAQAQESGKPQEIIEKMIGGRINKFLDEISLLGQPFVKDPSVKIGKLIKDKGAEVINFVRYEVGEGIEKKEDNFVDEVMAQVREG